MRSILVACLLSLSLASAALAEGFVSFDVSADRSGKLNSRNMVLEFQSIAATEATGDVDYLEARTEFTALDFHRDWPQNFAVGTGGEDWPGGGFAQFGFVSFDYQSRSTLTAELEGLWIFPIGHPRESEPAPALLTLVIHGNGEVEMWVELE